MKTLDVNDTEAAEEIESRQIKIRETIKLAEEKKGLNQIREAISLFEEAQHLSMYVNDSLVVRVMNETSDNDLWHYLDKQIKELQAFEV